ncbi:tRNA preQ1(34) S-adenosylmethionine ribosyltransferase-isomerase QueA [Rickettsiales endosymbiont of Stachyamoeba lipophora]|uniref:tRNA preQ1(34) S-adenosylmethionine ribosyltransferase-isomerase QueA n=1 Tax=Rickettsiales endosymbiont of Stachyamoeba lipophora TaxID=2486578 RepID=UPI0026B79E94
MKFSTMKLSDFDFELPEGLIAKHPTEPRDQCKMLVVDNDHFDDKKFYELLNYVNAGDVVVFNDTKVLPSYLKAYNNNGALININLHKYKNDLIWEAFVKPAKRVRVGEKLVVADDFVFEITAKDDGGIVYLKTNYDTKEFFNKLDYYGKMPIPPYIKREVESGDEQNYQTVYAKFSGSVAAPTAGLHFTDDLLKRLVEKGVSLEYVTLHVGAGTFMPVKVDHIKDHVMHSEYCEISFATANKINQAKANGNKIIAVGTTTLRTLESAVDKDGLVRSFCGNTNIFITPGAKIKSADMLITNFHLPKSTLLMLVSAFCGYNNIINAYKHAINNQYRFFSYGDACLLFKA